MLPDLISDPFQPVSRSITEGKKKGGERGRKKRGGEGVSGISAHN